MRSLRALPRVLPHVLRARHRDGLAPRAHLPGQVAGRRTDGAERLDRAPSLPLSRLPRVRNRVPGGGALRAAHRGREGRDRAPAARGPGSADLPLAELRAPARAPAPARSRRVGSAPLPGERPAAARAPEWPDPAPARNASGMGRAAADGSVEGRAGGATPPDTCRRSAAGARGVADRMRAVRRLRRP